jgi:hypothetical protein
LSTRSRFPCRSPQRASAGSLSCGGAMKRRAADLPFGESSATSISRSARNPRIPRTTNYGLRRENDSAYAPFRMSIKGSSDSAIPSVSWPGRNSNFFSASALLAKQPPNFLMDELPERSAPATSRRAEIDRFLDQVKTLGPAVKARSRGRLIFGLDATMSRQPTWDISCARSSRERSAVEPPCSMAARPGCLLPPVSPPRCQPSPRCDHCR